MRSPQESLWLFCDLSSERDQLYETLWAQIARRLGGESESADSVRVRACVHARARARERERERESLS